MRLSERVMIDAPPSRSTGSGQRRIATRPKPNGFTFLELLLVIILVIVFVALAMDRLLPLRGAAEAVSVARNVGVMRSALGIEVGERVVRDGAASLGELHRGNPMEILQSPPANYLGELDGPDPATIEGGHWYFDSHSRELVYRVRWPRYFDSELEGPPRIRWRLLVEYHDRDATGDFTPGADSVSGVRLHSPDRYDWQDMDLPALTGVLDESQDQ